LKDNQEVILHRTTHTLIFGGTELDSAGSNPHLLQTGADQHSWMHCDPLWGNPTKTSQCIPQAMLCAHNNSMVFWYTKHSIPLSCHRYFWFGPI